MPRTGVFKIKVMTAALAAAFAGGALANPVNPVVASGQAVFQQNGKTLTVTNTPSAIINWQSFNIDRGELTRFIQQSATSQVLNRVTGGDPSKILGSLQSNGRVILINPNGVAFGKGAQVDVAGLLVSTLQLKDADFLAGKLKFNDTPGAGSIKNEGTIKTASGGQVILIAPQIENSGLIHTPEGQIMLLAGKSVTIADPDKPAIQVEITNSEQQAVNIGTLIGKEISLYGGIVRNSGTIQATTAVVGQNGKISLRARYEVENTGTLQANGAQGGDIVIQAEQGMAKVQGIVEAKALKPEQIVAQQQSIEQKVRTASQPLITVVVETPAVETPAALADSSSDTIIRLQAETLSPASTASPAPDSVWVKAAGAVAFTDNSIAQATPASGPLIPLDSSPINPQNPMLPTRQVGVGGSVRILGRRVGVLDGATIDTTGASGGGEILVGGDWQGHNPEVQNAQATFVAATARLDASATEFGKGGKVVVWADDTTHMDGQITAKGGVLGGNGGFAEISGKVKVQADGHADLSAPQGKAGTLLLDPGSITITTSSSDASTGMVNNGWINTQLGLSSLILATTDASLSTNGATQDITVGAAITWSAANTLTLTAGNNIAINSAITSSNVGGGLILNAAGTANLASTISLAGGTLAGTATLTASAGTLNNVTLGTNLSLTGNTTITGGLTLSGSTVTINSGAVLLYSGTQTLGGTGNLVFAGASNSWLYRSGAAATLTVGPNVTVSGTGTGTATFGYYNDEVINFRAR
ncbi:MAG: filamentous hemagglutinin N-terminal domain-containing protein [Propionivibrio sp.]|nr:filamentous hemagglutinin N-terminal domain-containing protein [Propionivibrio sp.]